MAQRQRGVVLRAWATPWRATGPAAASEVAVDVGAALSGPWSLDAVAIDAPSGPSEEAHEQDLTDRFPGVAEKYRRARCSEVHAAAELGVFVPLPTPPGVPVGTWMEVGREVWRVSATRVGDDQPVLETFPHASFRRLAGSRRLPAKRSREGRRVRRALLAEELDGVGEGWGHDLLDAAACALVARRWACLRGTDVPALASGLVSTSPGGDACDGSRLWVAARRTGPERRLLGGGPGYCWYPSTTSARRGWATSGSNPAWRRARRWRSRS